MNINYESQDLLRSNQQPEEGETTSTRTGVKKSSRKNKSKTKESEKGSRTKATKRTKETEETTVQDLTPGNNERNVLREKSTNEQQIQNEGGENVILDNIESNNTNKEQENVEPDKATNNKSSFIWKYLEKLSPSVKYKKRVKCLVPITGSQSCGHIMGSDGSTGNFIYHLAKHNITRDTEITEDNAESIDRARHMASSSVRKNQLDNKFVGIIVKDNQPLSIRDDEGFREFVEELDPFYELPSDKKIKELLAKGYNYCKQEITCLFEQGVTSCSLTLDLWTSRSRAGYLGVTCSFVDAQFELHEAILAIKYLQYPHTGDTIVECLNKIIHDWNLDGKVFTITTDNGSNMVKAGKLLKNYKNITRFPCAAHTLQLVVGKGLLPAERLVARAKRLINFFITPKQTEKLVDIQKSMKNVNQNEVNI
jgi:hypothetical protein